MIKEYANGKREGIIEKTDENDNLFIVNNVVEIDEPIYGIQDTHESSDDDTCI